MKVKIAAAMSACMVMAACQSSGPASGGSAAAPQAVAMAQPEMALADDAAAAPQAAQTQETALVASAQQPASLAAGAATGGQCSGLALAGGPPPKPARGADFASAAAKNVGNTVKRGLIQQIGGAVAGGLGAAVAGGVAQSTVRDSGDIKGVWMITDGRQDCACQISVNSLWKLKGKGADTGHSKMRGCTSPQLQQVAGWALGYSFSGYDAKFELKAADKQTTLATMNRDGMHYFSGTYADGTPVVMWREGQTYNQLAAFNR